MPCAPTPEPGSGGTFDVVVAGAGPSGCAAALSLAAVAPRLRICVVAPGPEPGGAAPVGETVPPSIQPVLEHLGLWGRFEAAGHCPAYRSASAWGGEALVSDEFLFHARQRGWRLDRSAFDAMMRDAARGVAAFRRGVAAGLVRHGDGWRIALADGAALTAGAVVDATGRAAALARHLGLAATALDRLVCCWSVLGDRPGSANDLMLEAVPDGWWYTAGLPDGRRAVALMTDGDLVRRLGLRRDGGFLGRLAETRHLRGLVEGATVLEAPRLRAARSAWVRQPADLPFLCVGDAAATYDPVSGQGLLKALRSGVFASYAVADRLLSGDGRGLARYAALAERDVEAYRGMLGAVYARERRWPDHPFWRRRRAASTSDEHEAAP